MLFEIEEEIRDGFTVRNPDLGYHGLLQVRNQEAIRILASIYQPPHSSNAEFPQVASSRQFTVSNPFQVSTQSINMANETKGAEKSTQEATSVQSSSSMNIDIEDATLRPSELRRDLQGRHMQMIAIGTWNYPSQLTTFPAD